MIFFQRINSNVIGSGYYKERNGLLIQWGDFTIKSGSFMISIPFDTPFVSRSANKVIVSPLSSVDTFNINWGECSGSVFNVGRTPNTADTAFYWIAIGKWK
jgi:hypothetical protein